MTEHSFDEVWPELAGLCKQVHRVLADGCINANRVRAEHLELRIDSVLWAGLVRAYAAKHLGAEVREEGYELELGFNLSTTLRGGNKCLRVLKAAEGRMPRADSIGRKRFFNQNLPLPFDPAEVAAVVDEQSKAPHFVLKWTTGSDGSLCSLDLGQPKPLLADSPPDAEHEWFWVEPVFDLTRPHGHDEVQQFEMLEDIPGLSINDDEEDIDETGTDDE
jgi:hypothetical protein